MSNSWGAAPQGSTPEPAQPAPDQTPRRKGPVIAAVVAVVAVIAAAAGGGWYLLNGNGSDGGSASAADPAFSSVQETTSETPGEETADSTPEEVVETVTVTAEPEPEQESGSGADSASASDLGSGSGSARNFSGGDLRCDGRNVLVVGSVMSNSPTFDQEISATLSANPGATVLAPGTCASLRSQVDGAGVYAVVVDYGSDVSGLCSAEAAGGGYSRVLDDTPSYRSPC